MEEQNVQNKEKVIKKKSMEDQESYKYNVETIKMKEKMVEQKLQELQTQKDEMLKMLLQKNGESLSTSDIVVKLKIGEKNKNIQVQVQKNNKGTNLSLSTHVLVHST